jgi:hypothetical protein
VEGFFPVIGINLYIEVKLMNDAPQTPRSVYMTVIRDLLDRSVKYLCMCCGSKYISRKIEHAPDKSLPHQDVPLAYERTGYPVIRRDPMAGNSMKLGLRY